MMGLLRAMTKSNRPIQMGLQNQGLALSLSRQLSTQTETPQQDNSVDTFLQNPSTGLVYGRIYGIGRHTRKSDIISMLGASNLSLDDVRFEYNPNYAPVAAMIQFPTRNAYDASLRAVVRTSRLFRMERADRQQWDTLPHYDGKTVSGSLVFNCLHRSFCLSFSFLAGRSVVDGGGKADNKNKNLMLIKRKKTQGDFFPSA
ncbi:uncharacterized protein [Nicotiana sylvestris]|uniref:uncharacterized protein isoform X3 n=1 Tax=Nicotiana sylvestris TaxID=4096 RepID=UPI00388CB2EE